MLQRALLTSQPKSSSVTAVAQWFSHFERVASSPEAASDLRSPNELAISISYNGRMLHIRFHSIELAVTRDALDVHAARKPSLENKNTPEVGTMLVSIAKDVIDGGSR